MASDLENLKAAKSRILEALAANAGKPNYTIEGQSVSYADLTRQLKEINELLAAEDGGEFQMQGIT